LFLVMRALTSDAIFIAAIFIEIAAALSLLQSSHAVFLREEFEPVLSYYRNHAAPVFGAGAGLLWSKGPQWFTDATVVGAVLFFLFFIAQARNAMAPFQEALAPTFAPIPASNRAEATLDWVLPVLFCGLGALIAAPTLLPLLAVPAALVLYARRLLGLPSWFEVTPAFYLNLLVLAAALLLILSLG
jgi:hypothetical protein